MPYRLYRWHQGQRGPGRYQHVPEPLPHGDALIREALMVMQADTIVVALDKHHSTAYTYWVSQQTPEEMRNQERDEDAESVRLQDSEAYSLKPMEMTPARRELLQKMQQEARTMLLVVRANMAWRPAFTPLVKYEQRILDFLKDPMMWGMVVTSRSASGVSLQYQFISTEALVANAKAEPEMWLLDGIDRWNPEWNSNL